MSGGDMGPYTYFATAQRRILDLRFDPISWFPGSIVAMTAGAIFFTLSFVAMSRDWRHPIVPIVMLSAAAIVLLDPVVVFFYDRRGGRRPERHPLRRQ